MSDNLLEIKNLEKHFKLKKSVFSKARYVRAVDDISFDIPKNSTYAVVGESGSGKTTLGRTLLKLIEPTGGEVMMDGVNILQLSNRDFMDYRRKMQIVFQDPYNSLHPRKLVKTIIGEGMKIHFKGIGEEEIREKIKSVLERVGLREEHMFRYPHEFSGGQRQRIAFARTIVLNPEFIVLDEPTSALDVSVQAMVLKMLKDTKAEEKLTYLFITHDLSVVDYLADYVAVLYLGQIIEKGRKSDVFNHPAHPYTELLLNSNPIPDPFLKREKIIAKGEIPSPINPPKGCRFHTRCRYAKDICSVEEPKVAIKENGHEIKCHFPLV
ncbi:MAG TPA: ATP-binding cassette domain-containing protein [Thermotogota bacterium]|mgnify:CR=1 FL=1|nr:ATP-binding cassette domain-containing protein [Thermotogota bacterium]HPJ89237.1 ATP-binding cassette domain-containing protein [Thermotogota bacterium]HPR95867.1 ATP-binding cassette domain-containing protein [Thermotogota bacterium]